MCSSRRNPEDLAAVRIARAAPTSDRLRHDRVGAGECAVAARAWRDEGRHQRRPAADRGFRRQNPDIDFATAQMQKGLKDAVGADSLDIIDATGLPPPLMGDSIATNPVHDGICRGRRV